MTGKDYPRKPITKRYLNAWAALMGGVEAKVTDCRGRPQKPPKDPKIKPVTEKESILQTRLVAWARAKGYILISIPNQGKRTPWQGERERAMGMTAGVSDLFLAHRNAQYGGFWVEMKSKYGRPTLMQLEWIHKMRAQGYKAEWYDDWEKARDAIMEYLLEGC
jgi:hypothetical protein